MNSSVAIIIVNWNSYDVTSQCLSSLRDLNFEAHEVIVADNGSNDDSGDLLKANFPEITLLKNKENLGFTGGNNLGIRYALSKGFEYLLLLNNDTVVTPDFLKVLSASIDKAPNVGAIQPKIMFNQERNIIWSAGGILKKSFFVTTTRGENEQDEGQFDEKTTVDWITGCCFMVRSEIVEQVGLLDDRLFIYYEDFDWSLKIRNLGFKLLFDPNAVIYHEVGMSNKNRAGHDEGNISPFSHYTNIRNHLFMVRTHAKGISVIGAWLYQGVKFVGYVSYFTARRRFKKLRATLRGFKHGVLN